MAKLGDLGSVRTVARESDAKFSFLSRRGGRMAGANVEFGISILSVHPQITSRASHGLRQQLSLLAARFACTAGACLRSCRTASEVRAQDRSRARA